MLAGRLRASMQHRSRFEDQWKTMESYLYNQGRGPLTPTISFDSPIEAHAIQDPTPDDEGKTRSVYVPQIIRNIRILHSQLSANPPSSVATPNNAEERKDIETAKVVNDVINDGLTNPAFAIREVVDRWTLSSQVYGTGFLKVFYDQTKGEVKSFNKESMELTLKGDNNARACSVWAIYLDSTASCQEKIRYYFEEERMPLHVALSIWPGKEDILRQGIIRSADEDRETWHGSVSGNLESANIKSTEETDIVRVFHYVEGKGIENGMAGRMATHLIDGTLLSPMKELNTPDKTLDLIILTDIDVPGQIYGKAPAEYALELSIIINDLDTLILDNIEIHGNLRLVVYDGADVNESDLEASPVKVIQVKGGPQNGPHHLTAPPLPPDIYRLRDSKVAEIDAVMAVNEALQGQIPRELSGFAVQTAMEAANLSRVRLYNKFKTGINLMWDKWVKLGAKYWDVARKVRAVGEENEVAVKQYTKDNLVGGYTINTTYGEMFSLDPNQRRQQIMQAEPYLSKAGVNPKVIAKQLRYTDIEAVFDPMEVAKKRQLEIFDKIIESYDPALKTIKKIPADIMPVAFHVEMVEAGYQYVMTREFLKMDKVVRDTIYEHIRQREQLAAKQAQPPQPPEALGEGDVGMAPMEQGAAPLPESVEMAMPDLGGDVV